MSGTKACVCFCIHLIFLCKIAAKERAIRETQQHKYFTKKCIVFQRKNKLEEFSILQAT